MYKCKSIFQLFAISQFPNKTFPLTAVRLCFSYCTQKDNSKRKVLNTFSPSLCRVLLHNVPLMSAKLIITLFKRPNKIN